MKALTKQNPLRRAQRARAFTTAPILHALKQKPVLDTSRRANGFARRIPRSPRPSRPPDKQNQTEEHASTYSISNALADTATSNSNQLLAPVHVPHDPHAVLPPDHAATSILHNSSIVVHRQLEMMNVMLGFEQANKYVINDAQGNVIGFLAEQEHGLGNALARQTFRTHRSFTTHVFDKHEREVLRLHRPFSWISSKIRVYDCLNERTGQSLNSDALAGTNVGGNARVSDMPLQDMRVIGEAQQEWAPLRRRYNLFLHRHLEDSPASSNTPQITSGDLPLSKSTAVQPADPAKENLGFAQFAYVNEPFLSWDFSLKSADDRLIGSVNRNFAGFGREIFTDTGVYALRMDSAGLGAEPEHLISQTGKHTAMSEKMGMTLDQRAVMLATAVSIDFDYFSRTRGGVVGGGGFMPMWFPFPMGGGAAGEAGAEGAGGAAGEAGEAGSGALGEAGQAGRDGAAGGMAGAGTMAGYEAMQRGQGSDPQSPQSEDSWTSGSGGWGDKEDDGGGGDGGGGDGEDFFDSF